MWSQVVWFVATLVVSGQCFDDQYKSCGLYGFTLVEGFFGSEKHWLCVTLREIGSSSLTTYDTALIVDPPESEEGENDEDDDDEDNIIRALPVGHITMAYGFPAWDPDAGSVEGYIGGDHHFYGVLHLGNRTLYADPYNTDNLNKSYGKFEDELLVGPARFRRDYLQYGTPHFPYRTEQKTSRVPGIARSRVCELLLLADQAFFEMDANSSLDHTVRRMIHAVAQADIIFRNADFNEDGIPDNIGFSVRYILVLTSKETSTRVFGSLVDQRALDGRAYLTRFARLRRLAEVCLGVAFSGHAFHNRTLGLSFTSLGGGLAGAAGGLCDRRAFGRSFNTVAVSHATSDDDQRVPERIASLTLAHELGHSFGAHHDDNFPTEECHGHLMSSHSSPNTHASTYEFSVCSKRLIAATLNSMSYCLKERDTPYCGNGIVEVGEACDCGLPSRCSHRDPCCTPRAGGASLYDEGTLHKEGCSVAPKALCHPSQGLCCDATCKFADLTRFGFDCTRQHQECFCASLSGCACGLGGRCLPDGSCHAAECAYLGLRECQCDARSLAYKVVSEQSTLTVGRVVCGACCEVEVGSKPRCVPAPFAAKTLMDRGSMPPESWPDDQYNGPNMTIRLCPECKERLVRAWSPGSPCVTMNSVGLCSPFGVCKPGLHTPRSNIYPDIMSQKMHLVKMDDTQSRAADSVRSNIVNCLVFVLLII